MHMCMCICMCMCMCICMGICTACAWACAWHVRGMCVAPIFMEYATLHHNAPLTFEPGGAAEGMLSEGDVLVSIDGASCSGVILQALHAHMTWHIR